jgi:hypothetical protein
MGKSVGRAQAAETLTAATETTPLLNAPEVEIAHENETAVPVIAKGQKGGGGGESRCEL